MDAFGRTVEEGVGQYFEKAFDRNLGPAVDRKAVVEEVGCRNWGLGTGLS